MATLKQLDTPAVDLHNLAGFFDTLIQIDLVTKNSR